MLYPGEVEDEGHTGDEDEIEEAHGGKEVGHLSKVGAAQKHLEQHLDVEETIGCFISVCASIYSQCKGNHTNGSTCNMLGGLTL